MTTQDGAILIYRTMIVAPTTIAPSIFSVIITERCFDTRTSTLGRVSNLLSKERGKEGKRGATLLNGRGTF